MLTPAQKKAVEDFANGPLDGEIIHFGQLAVRELIAEYAKTLSEFEKYKQTEQARFHANAMIPGTWEREICESIGDARIATTKLKCAEIAHKEWDAWGQKGDKAAVAKQIERLIMELSDE